MTTVEKLTAPVSTTPHALALDLLLTARTPISHHDPDNHDKSNISLFNRAKHLLFSGPPADMDPDPSIDAFFVAHPVPADMADLFSNLDIPAFVAAAVLKLFADIYNNADGEGIFEGMERWDRLFARSKTAAVRSHSLRTFWDVLTTDLLEVAEIAIRRPNGQEVWGKFDLETADYVSGNSCAIVSAQGTWHTRHAEAWQWAYRAVFPAAIEDMAFPAPILPDETVEDAA